MTPHLRKKTRWALIDILPHLYPVDVLAQDPSSIYPNKRNKTPDGEVDGPLADEPLALEVPPTLPSQVVCVKVVLSRINHS